jgi:hypothetical protein
LATKQEIKMAEGNFHTPKRFSGWGGSASQPASGEECSVSREPCNYSITWIGFPLGGGGSGRLPERKDPGLGSVEIIDNEIMLPYGTEEVIMLYVPEMQGLRAETDGKRVFVLRGADVRFTTSGGVRLLQGDQV